MNGWLEHTNVEEMGAREGSYHWYQRKFFHLGICLSYDYYHNFMPDFFFRPILKFDHSKIGGKSIMSPSRSGIRGYGHCAQFYAVLGIRPRASCILVRQVLYHQLSCIHHQPSTFLLKKKCLHAKKSSWTETEHYKIRSRQRLFGVRCQWSPGYLISKWSRNRYLEEALITFPLLFSFLLSGGRE